MLPEKMSNLGRQKPDESSACNLFLHFEVKLDSFDHISGTDRKASAVTIVFLVFTIVKNSFIRV